MMQKEFVSRFAQDWLSAWNAHDLARILSHYADDLEMSSPAIVQLAQEPSGVLRGKTAVAAYWVKALGAFPHLKFELLSTLVGVNTLALHYKGMNDRQVTEVFEFNADGKVVRAMAHYAT